MAKAAPPKPAPAPAPPPPPAPAGKRSPSAATSSPAIQSGRTATAHRVVIFGTGGIGKSELIANLKKIGINPLFFDLEDGTRFLDVDRVSPPDYESLEAWLRDSDLLAPYGAVAIDSLTRLEEMCADWVVRNIKTDSGSTATSIESYGYGKGYSHVYDAFTRILASLDAIVRSGKHACCTAHECTTETPNPHGEDWLEYQPRLQSPKKTAMIRERVREWCDHLLYIGYDTAVVKGRGVGSGTRTIYTAQMPTHWAKSRSTSESFPYAHGDARIWQVLFGG